MSGIRQPSSERAVVLRIAEHGIKILPSREQTELKTAAP
jgi:hypothetical protein